MKKIIWGDFSKNDIIIGLSCCRMWIFLWKYPLWFVSLRKKIKITVY
jgi:hypothetical protein